MMVLSGYIVLFMVPKATNACDTRIIITGLNLKKIQKIDRKHNDKMIFNETNKKK